MFGEEWTAREIAAVIIGLTILAISITGVFGGMNSISGERASTDIRRISSTLESVDQKPGTVVRLNFATEYSIEVESDGILLHHPSAPSRRRDASLLSDVSTGDLDGVDHICVRNDGDTLKISQDCSLPENADIDGHFDS